MLFVLACLVLIAAAAGQHEHHPNYHALVSMMDHYYLHVIDANGDGCATLTEELAQFTAQDPDGDCSMTWEEFHAHRLHVHGPIHPTDEQLRMQFHFYDTRGNTQPADGLYTCDDVRYYSHQIDLNGDGCLTLPEFEHAVQGIISASGGTTHAH